MQKLTLEGVKAAARDWYSRGMLIAQNVRSAEDQCIYSRDDGCRCAIGAALNDDTAKEVRRRFSNGNSLSILINRNLVDIDGEDYAQLRQIQLAHDTWMSRVRAGASKRRIQTAEMNFKRWIDAEAHT